MVPLVSWLPAAFKLIVASIRHPNTDKAIIVNSDKSVDIVPANQVSGVAVAAGNDRVAARA